VWAEFAVGFVILVLIPVLSMLYERAFCKYLCPLGTVNTILGRIPLFRIRRVESTCISCSKCDQVYPMNIDVSRASAGNSPECIACMECVTTCPTKKNSLVTTLGGKAIKVGIIVALGFGIYLGAAAIGQAAGMLHLTAPTLNQLSSEGSLDVADIKGSSTWGAVAESFGIDLKRLYRDVGVDGTTVSADTMLKDTGTLVGVEAFEADAVRVAVAKIIGVPYAGENGDLTPATPAVSAPAVSAPAVSAPAVSASEAFMVPADFALEGTMSIADLSAALKTSNQAIARLGLPADIPVDKPLRDMKDQYGYTITDLKDRIKK
jgi:ferredoxin